MALPFPMYDKHKAKGHKSGHIFFKSGSIELYCDVKWDTRRFKIHHGKHISYCIVSQIAQNLCSPEIHAHMRHKPAYMSDISASLTFVPQKLAQACMAAHMCNFRVVDSCESLVSCKILSPF